jgi:hypothetical protein
MSFVNHSLLARSKRSSVHSASARTSDGGGGGGRGSRTRACEMLIAIDEPLYSHYGRSLENVTHLVKDMMDRLNVIYYRTILR